MKCSQCGEEIKFISPCCKEVADAGYHGSFACKCVTIGINARLPDYWMEEVTINGKQ